MRREGDRLADGGPQALGGQPLARQHDAGARLREFKAGEGAAVRAYHRSLFDAFARRRGTSAGAAPMLDELGRTVDALDRLAR